MCRVERLGDEHAFEACELVGVFVLEKDVVIGKRVVATSAWCFLRAVSFMNRMVKAQCQQLLRR